MNHTSLAEQIASEAKQLNISLTEFVVSSRQICNGASDLGACTNYGMCLKDIGSRMLAKPRLWLPYFACFTNRKKRLK